jgi:hypothetical protein
LDGLIVKPEAAELQLNQEKTVDNTLIPPSHLNGDQKPPTLFDEKPQSAILQNKTHFYGSVKLDHTRLGTTAGQINTEILQHLAQLPGASVKVSLDIQVEVPSGIPDDIVRIVDENRKTLKFDDSTGFD